MYTKEKDASNPVHNPQHEGIYTAENSVVVVSEGDMPTFTSLKRLTSVTECDTFNGISLTIMDLCNFKGETVSVETGNSCIG